MQTLKENLREVVLSVSKKEFLSKGFKGASMRTIASKSGIGLSNIYNYFRSKDEIFCTILAPLIAAIDTVITKHHNTNISIDIYLCESEQKEMITDLIQLVEEYRDDLKLLLILAQGSSLQNFAKQMTSKNQQDGVEYIQALKSLYPEIRSDISPLFIHLTSALWIKTLEEIVSSDQISNKDIEDFIADYICYGTAGWKALMRVK